MQLSPKKFLSTAALAVAMSVGLAVPASANGVVTLTSSAPTISNGETITYTTSADWERHSQFFINGVVLGGTPVGMIMINPVAPWSAWQPCETIDVTLRVYSDLYEDIDQDNLYLWTDPYDASVTVEWIGDNSGECNDAWGAGARGPNDSGESLAATGSNASSLAALTGVAGIAALGVAAAVVLRSRRAQR